MMPMDMMTNMQAFGWLVIIALIIQIVLMVKILHELKIANKGKKK